MGREMDYTILLLYSGEIRNRGGVLVALEKSREGFLLKKNLIKTGSRIGKNIFCASTNLGNAQTSFLNAEFFVSRLYKTFALLFVFFFGFILSFIHFLLLLPKPTL